MNKLMKECALVFLSLLLTLTATLWATRASAQDLSRTVNLTLREVTVKEALLETERQSGVKFLLPEELVSPAKKVTLVRSGISVREAIALILVNTGLQYKLVNGYVVIARAPVPLRVSGRVTDAKTKEPMSGVSVRIRGGQGGTSTDANGYFTLTLPAEQGILIFSHLGFQSRELRVDKSNTMLNVAMAAADLSMNEVTVHARKRMNTESAVLTERKNASIIQDAISAAQIEKTGSVTTTQALQRVSGVTVTDDKFVAIRGLGDRSVIGQMNGIRLASSDPDRSAIPLDLIPASLLDNVTIYKTVTPDKPADAAAGIVELKTKSVPEGRTMELIAQTGLNTTVGLGGSYNSFWNSGMGFLGEKINNKNLSGDFKALAQQYPEGLGSIQKMISNSNNSVQGWKEADRVNKIMQGFDPVMTTRFRQAPLNQLYSATYGNSYTVFKKHRLGLILGGNYYRRISAVKDGDLTQYSVYQGVVTGNPDIYSFRNIPNYITPNSLVMGKYQSYKENTGTETLNYGVLAGLTYRFSPLHEISMQYLGSWGGETSATNLSGSYEYTGLPGAVTSMIYSLKQTYRSLNTLNLQGEHKLKKGEYSPRLSYNLATSRSGQNNPDFRFVSLADYTPEGGGWYNRPQLVAGGGMGSVLTYTKHLYALTSGYVNGFGTYGIIQAEPNGRRWRNLDEKNYNYKADLTIPFPLLGMKQEFKTGFNYLFRDRTFTENQLFLPGSNFAPNKALTLYDVEGDLDRLVSNQVIGIKTQDGRLGEGASPIGGFLYNSRKSPNNYQGYFETNAFYGMADLKLTENIRVAGGVRFERTNIGSKVDTAGIFLDPALTGQGPNGPKILPVFTEPNSAYKTKYEPYYSANLTYTLNRVMNFRGAFNTTLARPELRELTNVFEFDAFQMGLVVGNPNLKNQYTENMDFRWEWFPNRGEVIAVSAFRKKIKNQLVKVFNLKTDGLAATWPEFPTIQFQNDPNTGTVWGIELELVKDLGKLNAHLKNFFLGSNLLLAQSDIKKTPERYKANRSLDRYTPKNSPLFEQAPYSINVWLNYDNKKSGTDLTATFNMVGERLVQINLTGEPDLYTRPVPMLDLVFSQQLSRRILFRGYAKNVLNPAIKTVYANPDSGGKWYGNEYVNRSYYRGSEIMLGFTYKLY